MTAHPSPYAPLPLAVTVVPVLAAGVLFWGRGRALRREGVSLPGRCALLFGAGIAVALTGGVGLAHAARISLTYHELRLLCLGEAAAIPLALGITWLPKGRGWRALRRRLTGPVAPALWLVNLFLWHLPAALEAGLHHPTLEAVESLCYLAAGVNLYLALFAAPANPGASPELGRFAQTVAARGGGIVLANLLLWASHVTYPYFIHPDIRRQTSPLVDENVAGAVLFFVQLLALLAVGTWTYGRVSRRGRAVAQRRTAAPQAARSAERVSGRS